MGQASLRVVGSVSRQKKKQGAWERVKVYPRKMRVVVAGVRLKVSVQICLAGSSHIEFMR